MRKLKNKQIVIIGGGFSGLSLADFLADKGFAVSIFEKERFLGGLAGGFKKRGWDWAADFFYHHLFVKDRAILNWLDKFNLKEQVNFSQPKTSVLSEGSIFPFGKPGEILNFPHLDYVPKLHFGFGNLLLKLIPWLPWMDRVTVAEWLPKIIGDQGFTTIWKPLLMAKFGQDYWDKISLSWFWARIKSRTFKLGYPDRGFPHLAEEIGRQLTKKKVKIHYKSELTKLSQEQNSWRLSFLNGKELLAKKVVLTLPFPQSLKIVKPFLKKEEERKFNRLKTIACLNLILRLKEKFLPDDTYWLNILNPAFPFVVIVEQTNFVSEKNYNNEHLVYAGGYYQPNDPILKKTNLGVFRLFAPWLRKLNLDFERSLIGFDVFKSQFSQPVAETGYLSLRPQFKIDKGLYWLSPHHIYPWDRGLNFAVEYGQRLGRVISEI